MLPLQSPDPPPTPPPDGYPTADCASCQASIIWTYTTSRKRMPVDAVPTSKGTVELRWEGDQVLSKVLQAHKAFGRTDLRTSHFATCPHADLWRRGRTIDPADARRRIQGRNPR